MKYTYLQQEIDSLKLQMKEIALREQSVPAFKRPQVHYTLPKMPDVLEYSYQEMLTSVEFEIPVTTKLIDKQN